MLGLGLGLGLGFRPVGSLGGWWLFTTSADICVWGRGRAGAPTIPPSLNILE